MENVLPQPVTAQLGGDLGENDEREDYLRATLTRNGDGALVATPFGKQDSSMFATIARSDALIIRAPFAPCRKGRQFRRNHPLGRQSVQHLIAVILDGSEEPN